MNATRRSGLVTLLAGAAVATILGVYASWLRRHGWQIVGYGWGIPGAFALAGLVQLVSGVPFSELSGRWDALEGWQRGIFGTLIFLVAVAFIFLCLLVFARVKYGP